MAGYLNAAVFFGLVCVLQLASLADACVFLMGQSPDSLQAPAIGTDWTYGFRGDDWSGVDGTNTSWVCLKAKNQSPINIPYKSLVASKKRGTSKTTWLYPPLTGNGSNIKVFNNGHTVQIQWPAGYLNASVQIPTYGYNGTDLFTGNKSAVKFVAATPLQFHFHTSSEHTVDGVYYPLELHIVHSIPPSQLPGCPASGCLTVTGVLFALSADDSDNPYLNDIWSVMPYREGLVNYLPANGSIQLQKLLPTTRTYVQYGGSLTTPPCTEGVLWHVFSRPIPISLAQLRAYEMAVGLKDCQQAAGKRRALQSTSDSHPELPGSRQYVTMDTGFKRGSYTGFTRGDLAADAASVIKSRRALLANASNYVCKVVSYGVSNRNPQPLNTRTPLLYV